VLTHQVSVDRGRRIVVKRYEHADREQPAREWRALLLLAEHAPGLAPEPILADLAGNPAVIEMSLLDGEPLGGEPLTQEQESAVLRAVGQLWQAVPVSKVTLLPDESARETEAWLVQQVREMAASYDLGEDPVVRSAELAGLDWLSWAGVGGGEHGLPHVFGQGDSNLANFLWDGERVRIVDFEDSGVSDRAFELGQLVEHISARHDAGLNADQFAAAFDLTAAERARLADTRRLAALYWLLRLRPGGDVSERNPPGTLRRQAERLLALL
jgi:aminoglycoside phosphotransferase (APT) family kinase protein